MNKIQLGSSPITVTPVGLGCWQFSGGKGLSGGYWKGLNQDAVNQIVSAAIEEGISWFDTAEVYGMGTSERSLGSALVAAECKPGDVVIATKWNPIMRRARSISRTFSARVAALEPFPIDLHQVHNPFSFSTPEAEMREMAALAQAGNIRAIGVSNFSASQMRAASAALESRGLSLVSNQVLYNLLDRKIEDNGIMETARELGVTIIAYSPLSQGILTGRFHDDPESVRSLAGPRKYRPRFRKAGLARSEPLIRELRAIAGAHDASPAQVSLAWLIQHDPGRVVVIPGASSVTQVRSNATAMRLRLTDEEINRLDDVSHRVVS